MVVITYIAPSADNYRACRPSWSSVIIHGPAFCIDPRLPPPPSPMCTTPPCVQSTPRRRTWITWWRGCLAAWCGSSTCRGGRGSSPPGWPAPGWPPRTCSCLSTPTARPPSTTCPRCWVRDDSQTVGLVVMCGMWMVRISGFAIVWPARARWCCLFTWWWRLLIKRFL